jgi:chaperonin GroES
MKLFLALLIVVITATHSYTFRPVGFKRSFMLQGHRLDNIEIDGDLRPMANNLLVKVKEALSETKGGLFIPDNAKERPTEGLVVANGPGRVHPETARQLDIAVQAGKCVIYGKYDGSELQYDEVPHQMIKDDDVLLTYPADQEATADNVECVKDQILIKMPPLEEKNTAGLIIAVNSEDQKRPDYGTVFKVGPGRQAGNGEYMTPQVKVGDEVKFRDFAGSEIKLGTEKFLVIRSYDILAAW